MPRIFDNIDNPFVEALKNSLNSAQQADFCVGYFNLRGWKLILDYIDQLEGKNNTYCRLLIGMQKLPHEVLYQFLSPEKSKKSDKVDRQQSIMIKKQIAEDFKKQLISGYPTNEDEKNLQRLKQQLEQRKVQIKLFTRYPLHAKLYLIHHNNQDLPIVGYLGSSNLTFSGLVNQGELNIDVLDHDASHKLLNWFNERWEDNENFSMDITDELIEILDQSWTRETLIPPYYIYLKMVYHLSQEARDGISQYPIPKVFKLFPFQENAVQMSAYYLNQRRGVMVGDVVGLGKTIVATAIAKIYQDDFGLRVLILCPKNLVSMWESYIINYNITGDVKSYSNVIKDLPNLSGKYGLVILDESHNLRNRNGKRYEEIQNYIESNECKCILLTATPYNKTNLDLSNQLRLFIPEEQYLGGIKPEALIQSLGGIEAFNRKYNKIPVSSLLAFEKSEFAEDWQQLMNRYMIRRTRKFVKDYYAIDHPDKGQKCLQYPDGSFAPFPDRVVKTVEFALGNTETDVYARLYSEQVVNLINGLNLPRYGLGEYQLSKLPKNISNDETQQLQNLTRSRQQLIGFSRTTLLKRLESSGQAFIESIDRHLLRNYVYLYAIENNLDLPIGSQSADYLEEQDEDGDSIQSESHNLEVEENGESSEDMESSIHNHFLDNAKRIYDLYQTRYRKRFKWIRSTLFTPQLKQHIQEDNQSLHTIQELGKNWSFQQDNKFLALHNLLTKNHKHDKVLIFTQFADTAHYLKEALEQSKVKQVAVVTGNNGNPTDIVHRFSPNSNQKQIDPQNQVRVLITTDVLSEGQNLQDCWIIVNYDLPWAIIRLIQRAGRIDRIGQQQYQIYCYSFFPADGLEKIINLRGRLFDRLQQNSELVGTDEKFFEDQSNMILDLYHEKTGIMDEIESEEVDLTSTALQIWKNAIQENPSLETIIKNLPNVVYSTRQYQGDSLNPQGVISYIRTSHGTDALCWMNQQGESVTQSQKRILSFIQCLPDTPAIPRHPQHHELVKASSEFIIQQEKQQGGVLGNPKSARVKTYNRLNNYIITKTQSMPLFLQSEDWLNLKEAVQSVYHYPLTQRAINRLNRQFQSGITDEDLAKMVRGMWEDESLCIIHKNQETQDHQIICSLGFFDL